MAENLNYIAKDEIFKTVKINGEEYGNYLVSNYGRIYSLIKRKFLKGYKNRQGYVQYFLYKNGERKHISEHRLVALTFLNRPNGLKIINHKDEKRDNSYYKNLEWCTHSYNITYRNAQQRRIEHCIKPVIQMDDDYNRIAIYRSLSEASRKTAASVSTIFVGCRYGVKRKGYYWAYANS